MGKAVGPMPKPVQRASPGRRAFMALRRRHEKVAEGLYETIFDGGNIR